MAKHEWPEDGVEQPAEEVEEQETTVVSTDTTEAAEDTEAAEGAEAVGDAEAIEGTEAVEDAEAAEAADEDGEDAEDFDAAEAAATGEKASTFARALAFAILPALALLLAAGAGYLKWADNSVRSSESAGIESLQAAKDATVKMLSYKPDSVEQDLGAARDLLTGSFREDYIKLTEGEVIPGSKQKQISAVATVPAAATISAKPNHAEALVFVNQTVIVGQSAPTAMASSVKVTMDKVGDRWLMSAFDPV